MVITSVVTVVEFLSESADFSFVKYGFYKVGCDGSFAFDEYGSAEVTRVSGSSQNSHHFLCYLKQNTIFTSAVTAVEFLSDSGEIQ